MGRDNDSATNFNNYDFCGYVTKNDIRCTDGRTIRQNAFKDNDGNVVPLVWNHQHNDVSNVLGKVLLENRSDGVYGYGMFNKTQKAEAAREQVQHGDLTSMSIYANQLQQHGSDVVHGCIREVSLVLAGANKGAKIDSFIMHGDYCDEDAVIYTGEDLSDFQYVAHTDSYNVEPENDDIVAGEFVGYADGELEHADEVGVDVGAIFDSMTEEQKGVCIALVAQAISDAENGNLSDDDDDEGGTDMSHNVFEQDYENDYNVLSHSEMEAIFSDAQRGTLHDACLAHGIENIDYLFPDNKNVSDQPDWVKRDTNWVSVVMGGVHKLPFARTKTMSADLTQDTARAKGYMKGGYKFEEVFSLSKRTTDPQTIYKKQKLDRDDIIDITDFNVVAWLKSEMRMMLDEEIARAILIGDGRLTSDTDKIKEDRIRPIWKDADFYTIKKAVTLTSSMTDDQKAKAYIRAAVKARKDYKGSGNPVFFTTEDVLTDMLLIEDTNQHRLYKTESELATAMRVSRIVTVPVMENQTRTVSGVTHSLVGIIVNLSDYGVGADKGGAVAMFDDFDIDYNAEKYLIETRCSGALIKPYSAIAIEAVLGE